ncbi:MAG: nickel-dependent hydrogenase b-type cytochrome subunit, partial [Hyphomicrobiales bacterium]|nr:nickel-dependent hydrogenase b-type cytochrome subunit [Hyphomicrobiales bacterium]
HKVIAKLLLLFIAVHVAANVMYQFFKKEPLITAMVTGEKPAGDYVDEPAEGGAGVVVAITVYATCLGLVLGTVYWFSGSLLGGA